MNKRHINGTDGLRAIAIIGIIIYHMAGGVFPGGFLGVNGFLLIMGFFMSYGLSDSFNVKRFYVKKIKRIYPPLLITLILVTAAVLIMSPGMRRNTFPEVMSIIFGYNNWYQIGANSSYFTKMLNSSPLTHMWYTGLTVQYYLIWPVIAFIANSLISDNDSLKWKSEVGKGEKIFLTGIICLAIMSAVELALLYVPGKDPSRIYYGTDTRFFAVLLGIALGLAVAHYPDRHPENSSIVCTSAGIISIAGLIILGFVATGGSALTYRIWMQLSTVLYLILMVCVVCDQDTFGRVMDCLPLRAIGKVSYELYLVMYPCIYFMQKMVMKHGWGNAAYFISTSLLIAAAAVVVHFAAEGIIKAMDHFFDAERFLQGVLIPFLLLFLGIGLAFLQGRRADALGGNKDMAELEAELNNNKKMLKSQQKKKSNTDDAKNKAQTDYSDVTAIGDSVMLGAANSMMNDMPGIYVDAVVGRQITDANSIIDSLKQQGRLGNIVIIHLGTNGNRAVEKYISIIDDIGQDKKVFWVTSHGVDWSHEVNITINDAASQRKDITVLDWDSYSQGHPDWFYSDGIHLTPPGRDAYAQFLKDAVDKAKKEK